MQGLTATQARYLEAAGNDRRGIAALDQETIRLPANVVHPEERVVRPALTVLFRLAVGPGADYYGPRFLAFERDGRALTAWHWPALFLPAVWAFYRKLWVAGLAFTLLPLAGGALLAWIAPWLDDSTWLWLACAALLVFVMPGVVGASLANALLYRRVRARIRKAEARADTPSHAASEVSCADPVSPAAAFLCGSLAAALWVAALGPLLTTAYVEHSVRVKVGKALAALAPVQTQIEDSWTAFRHWPRQGFGIELPARAGAVLFDEISVDRETGRVKLAVGASIPELAGRAILLAPALDRRDRLHWFCVPVGIPDRFLPQACRAQQR
jgi:cytochrome c biogenesis protein CcdA